METYVTLWLAYFAEHDDFKIYWLCSTWRRQWHPTPVLLPGKSHGRRSLEGCSPWGLKESDMTERLHFHFSLSCIGEGNGNPLQCSCLENPRDGGAWWAALYGVAQNWTRLKWLSSSSSSSTCQVSLLRLNNIPLCLYATVCSSIPWCILGLLLPFVNNAAMNMDTNNSPNPYFQFFWVYIQKQNYWIIW